MSADWKQQLIGSLESVQEEEEFVAVLVAAGGARPHLLVRAAVEAAPSPEEPLRALAEARTSLLAWAGSDNDKKIWAEEVDDVLRRFAAEQLGI